jgi:hypothetical protein
MAEMSNNGRNATVVGTHDADLTHEEVGHRPAQRKAEIKESPRRKASSFQENDHRSPRTKLGICRHRGDPGVVALKIADIVIG